MTIVDDFTARFFDSNGNLESYPADTFFSFVYMVDLVCFRKDGKTFSYSEYKVNHNGIPINLLFRDYIEQRSQFFCFIVVDHDAHIARKNDRYLDLLSDAFTYRNFGFLDSFNDVLHRFEDVELDIYPVIARSVGPSRHLKHGDRIPRDFSVLS